MCALSISNHSNNEKSISTSEPIKVGLFKNKFNPQNPIRPTGWAV